MSSATESSRYGFLRIRSSGRGKLEKRPIKDAPGSAVLQSCVAVPTVSTRAAQNLVRRQLALRSSSIFLSLIMFYLPKLDFFKDSSGPVRDREGQSRTKLLALPSAEASHTTSFPDSPGPVVVLDPSPDTLELRLQDFYSLICCDKSIESTRILSTELYSEWTGRVIHQFVILELHREGRAKVWAKLERTLAYFRHAITHLGFAPASDKVSRLLHPDSVPTPEERVSFLSSGGHEWRKTRTDS